jgi:4-hydroxyacetophenone monooxygenase
MIGTGASGAQVGPTIAPDVSALTVFMRSRHWVIPNPQAGAVPVPEGVRWAVRHIPLFAEYLRFTVYWTSSDGLWEGLVMDPAWAGNPLSISQENDVVRQYVQNHMNSKLASRPELIEKLTPDSPLFSKRPIMDAGWFDMFLRDNVTLEDRAIECVTPNGIRTADGEEHEFDVIVAATGFTLKKLAGDLEVVGENGRNLGEEWGEEDPVGYFGTMVPGFPNYFHIHGPNSGPNHGAGINLLAESQVHYIIKCLDEMVERGAAAMAPTQEATDQFNEVVQAQAQRMVWAHPKAKNNFKNSKGRIVISWPFRLLNFWMQARGPKVEDFKFIDGKAA